MLIFYLKYLVNEWVCRLAINTVYCALIPLSNQLLSSSLILYLKYLVIEQVWRLAIHIIYCALIPLSNQLLSSSLIFPILHFTTRCFPGVWFSISIYPMALILIVMVSSENKLGHGSHHR